MEDYRRQITVYLRRLLEDKDGKQTLLAFLQESYGLLLGTKKACDWMAGPAYSR
jgi:hypothetical protein